LDEEESAELGNQEELDLKMEDATDAIGVTVTSGSINGTLDVSNTTALIQVTSPQISPAMKLLQRLATPTAHRDPTVANLYQCLHTMALSSGEVNTEFMTIYSILEGKLGMAPSSSSAVQKPTKDPFQEGGDVYINSLTLTEQRDAIKNIIANAATAQEFTPKDLRIRTPKDMTIQLMEHQKLGVEWMLKMERGSNKGGILADDMGKSCIEVCLKRSLIASRSW
jgi:SNF2 family DNA or RNA helicase